MTEIVPPEKTRPDQQRPAQTRPSDQRIAPSTSPADRFMRKLLRLPEGTTATADEARAAFQTSILISATRCVLMYVFFPFVLPLIGVAKGVGPVIGLIIGMLAIVSITFSIRRFWRANHSKRWHYTVFGALIIGFLIVLAVKDFSTIVS
jgi:formate hydrogenlyase subunit 3/multisubunit Na+/H+ antiporter MnhD subunit